jgi:hypothetical protein
MKRGKYNFPNVIGCDKIGCEKITFDGKSYRTNSYNSVLDLIYQQTNELRGEKIKNGESFNTFSASVPRAGGEIVKLGTFSKALISCIIEII